MANFTVNFKEYPEQNLIRIEVYTKYAVFSTPCKDVPSLIKEINDICGEGSYLIYSKSKIQSNGTPEYRNGGKLTYAQQGFKTDVIEQAFHVAQNCFEHFNYNIGEWCDEFKEWED